MSRGRAGTRAVTATDTAERLRCFAGGHKRYRPYRPRGGRGTRGLCFTIWIATGAWGLAAVTALRQLCDVHVHFSTGRVHASRRAHVVVLRLSLCCHEKQQTLDATHPSMNCKWRRSAHPTQGSLIDHAVLLSAGLVKEIRTWPTGLSAIWLSRGPFSAAKPQLWMNTNRSPLRP